MQSESLPARRKVAERIRFPSTFCPLNAVRDLPQPGPKLAPRAVPRMTPKSDRARQTKRTGARRTTRGPRLRTRLPGRREGLRPSAPSRCRPGASASTRMPSPGRLPEVDQGRPRARPAVGRSRGSGPVHPSHMGASIGPVATGRLADLFEHHPAVPARRTESPGDAGHPVFVRFWPQAHRRPGRCSTAPEDIPGGARVQSLGPRSWKWWGGGEYKAIAKDGKATGVRGGGTRKRRRGVARLSMATRSRSPLRKEKGAYQSALRPTPLSDPFDEHTHRPPRSNSGASRAGWGFSVG